MRYKAVISYDGTLFHGFQKQKKHRSVQEELENAIYKAFDQKKEVYASGRTDKGVHALAQVIHFDLNLDLQRRNLKKAMNSFLPQDIYVNNVEKVDDNFHARFNAKAKTYRYLLDLNEVNPLLVNYRYYYKGPKLDLSKLDEIPKIFIGTKDFKAFSKGNEKENTVRTIYTFTIKNIDNLLVFEIKGDGFLHNMIRLIIGMILEVLKGKLGVNKLKEILDSKDQKLTPKLVPGSGLYLVSVEY
jgi:tRNA pseudouridine38-40 synthase